MSWTEQRFKQAVVAEKQTEEETEDATSPTVVAAEETSVITIAQSEQSGKVVTAATTPIFWETKDFCVCHNYL